MTPSRPHLRRAASLLGIGALLAVPAAASAATTQQSVAASETVSAGSLSFINNNPASTLAFPATTINGTAAQTSQVAEPFDVDDATGSGSGWNITATSTTFKTSGGATLPAPVVSATPAQACDSTGNCTLASNSVTYPYTIPAGSTAPTATKLYNAAANSGMAAQTITPTWTLTVPANASAGSYSSTWTVSLVSAP